MTDAAVRAGAEWLSNYYRGDIDWLDALEIATGVIGDATQKFVDFDAIWRRYYDTANRRFEFGLTYNELWFVVYGEKKEEEEE